MGIFSSRPAEAPIAAPVPVAEGSSGGGIVRTLVILAGIAFLIYLGISFYNYLRRRNGLPEISFTGGTKGEDLTPEPIDGKKRTVIPATSLKVGNESDYGIQFWMYIQDWDYKFGQPKYILERNAPNNKSIKAPQISLHPTDNTLQVSVSLFRTQGTARATNMTGDVFTCSVENVPLQTWFSVSVTAFQRNLDIYINGRLVKSCVLPGVPRIGLGEIILNEGGGFSGNICNVTFTPNMLAPEDAAAYHAKGTNCQAPTPKKEQGYDPNSVFLTLFGYTFRFTTFNKQGTEISSYTF